MRAFLAALIAVVLIAVAVHYAFREIAPRWNAAVAYSVPDTVRLDRSDMPRPEGTLRTLPAAR